MQKPWFPDATRRDGHRGRRRHLSPLLPESAASPGAVGKRVCRASRRNSASLPWVRLSHGATKIDFAAIGGRWAVVEKGNYPAAPGKLRQMLLGSPI
jgi:hypothetical protein